MRDSDGARRPSGLDRAAEGWAETAMRLNPALATRAGYDAPGFADYSPEGAEALLRAARGALQRVRALDPADAVDVVTRQELEREISQLLEEGEAGLLVGELNVIASPPQEVRNAFDLMPDETERDWLAICARLAAVRPALEGYRLGLLQRAGSGPPLSRRQVLAVAEQAQRTAEGFFSRLVARPSLPEGLRADAAERAAGASAAYAELAGFLRRDLAPRAGDRDGVGRELYAVASRRFLGAAVDLDESYAWGTELLAEISERQARVAETISGERSVPRAIELLDRDEARVIRGVDRLRAWLQATSDAAVDALAGTHFAIPTELRRLECRIAPAQDGGIYYTEPSGDGSRPGRMWWSVPEGVAEFRAWREKTTVYHEGVPGHHLQMGGAAIARDRLNLWRRFFAGTSGHREGWALYAERLMEGLGFLDDPGELLGMLDAQRMRAARVVVDIGVHAGLPRPDGGGAWTAGAALDFMRGHTVMHDASLRYEVLRYLGWPGQAASYSIGQRIWEEARAESERAAAAAGRPFSPQRFHERALALGGVGLETLVSAMRRSEG